MNESSERNTEPTATGCSGLAGVMFGKRLGVV